jgi:hypothetical protein
MNKKLFYKYFLSLIFIRILFTSHMVYANTETVLTCKIYTIYKFKDGAIKTADNTVIYEVLEQGSQLSILTDNLDYPTVVSWKSDIVIFAENLSNDKVWNIANLIMRNNIVTDSQISIDRFSGKIVLIKDYSSGKLITKGSGICEKNSADKKRF